MSRKILFLALFSLTSLAPATAFGLEQSKVEDLTMADARSTFPGFEIKRDGNKEKVMTFGMIFKDCRDKFSFTTSKIDPQIQSKTYAGLRIRDAGGGRSCMAEHKMNGDDCGLDGERCFRLSKVDNTSLDFSDLPHVEVGLLRKAMGDKDEPDFENFDDQNPIVHKSREEIAAEARAAAEAKREAKIARLRQEVTTCRASQDELAIAHDALVELIDMNVVDDGEAARIQKKLDDAALSVFAKQVDKADDGELASLREEVGAWTAEHPEKADAAAKVYYLIAKRYLALGKSSMESFDQASASLSEAQELEGLSASAKTKMEIYQRDIAVDRVSKLAQNGMQNNFLFAPYYANLYNQVAMSAMSACNNEGASLEGCASAMNTVQTVAQLPAKARQVDQQRWQTWQQMQQILNGSNNTGNAQGNVPMWAGGTYGK